MFVRPTNPISHRLARIAFILATVGSLIVAVSGPLHRYLGLDIEAAIAVFRYGFYLTVAGIALGLGTMLPARPGDRRRGFVAAFLAIAIGLAGAWVPLHWFLQAQHRPAINDITTDTANPPPLVATAQLRRGAPNPPAYPKENAAIQRAAFPDIEPVILAVPPPRPSSASTAWPQRWAGTSWRASPTKAASKPSRPAPGSAFETISSCASGRRDRAAASTSVPRAASAKPISAAMPSGCAASSHG